MSCLVWVSLSEFRYSSHSQISADCRASERLIDASGQISAFGQRLARHTPELAKPKAQLRIGVAQGFNPLAARQTVGQPARRTAVIFEKIARGSVREHK